MGNQPSVHPFPTLKLSHTCQLPESNDQSLVSSPTGDRICVIPYRPKAGMAFNVYSTHDLSLLFSFGNEADQRMFKPISAVWTKQNELIVSSKDPNRLSIWSVETKKHLRDVSLDGSGITSLNALALSPGETKLYIAGYHQEDREFMKGSLFTLDMTTSTYSRHCKGKIMDVHQMCLRTLPPSPLAEDNILAIHCMMRSANGVASVRVMENVDDNQIYQCFPIPDRLKQHEVKSISADEESRYFFLSGGKGAILRGAGGLFTGTIDCMEDQPIITEGEGDTLCVFGLLCAGQKLVCLCYETSASGRQTWQLRVYDIEEGGDTEGDAKAEVEEKSDIREDGEDQKSEFEEDTNTKKPNQSEDNTEEDDKGRKKGDTNTSEDNTAEDDKEKRREEDQDTSANSLMKRDPTRDDDGESDDDSYKVGSNEKKKRKVEGEDERTDTKKIAWSTMKRDDEDGKENGSEQKKDD